MKRICAWCGQELAATCGQDSQEVTHGICVSCRCQHFVVNRPVVVPKARVMMGSAQDTREDCSSPPAEPCIELSLPMPSWQWTALERAADGQELTVGQMLRRLIVAYLAKQGDAWAADPCHPEMVNAVAGHPDAVTVDWTSPSKGECQ